ncbi:DUF1499 domain-containing protein [Cyanobium sp. Morenito 9A2]|uniref:DUF1499 domain-containing protein n=1 Tax=Cyanobium sp. Morenito 9A2 TaxID=2823718 RepID=UPI0020CE3C21|nr:DUF1499 domain-containing protein [Cyanobium sp. Morenito 9A2]MCP9849604.1 DUF1499 domain-containing protein [Cyanobium sp. Morenito 9A2]
MLAFLFAPLGLLAAPVLGSWLPALLLVFHFAGPVPDTLGPVAGQLPPCTAPAHCVREDWPVADPVLALGRLAFQLASTPGTRVERFDEQEPQPYLHATDTSSFFGFVDDLELLADPERGVLQVRSESRLGDSDLGVNQARVDGLRQGLAPVLPQASQG